MYNVPYTQTQASTNLINSEVRTEAQQRVEQAFLPPPTSTNYNQLPTYSFDSNSNAFQQPQQQQQQQQQPQQQQQQQFQPFSAPYMPPMSTYSSFPQQSQGAQQSITTPINLPNMPPFTVSTTIPETLHYSS